MFRVKICGVTTPDDARLVADAGADAVGLNFVAGSPRRLDIGAAARVAAAVPAGVWRVGVFAGASPDDIRRVAAAAGLDAVQLHGHLYAGTVVDPPSTCAALHGLPVIRAVRLGPDGLAEASRWFAEAAALGGGPRMALVDAGVARDTAPGLLGGRGEVVDWRALAAAIPLDAPLALAGGLTPENVEAAVRASGATAVDAASGVESSPGVKDPARVRAFVAAASRALPARPGAPA